MWVAAVVLLALVVAVAVLVRARRSRDFFSVTRQGRSL